MADVIDLRPPSSPIPRMSAKLRPSDLRIEVVLDLPAHTVTWHLTPEQAREFGSWFNSWAVESERTARKRSPKPRWLAWVNEVTAEELAREAGLSLAIAREIVQRRDFQQTGGHLVRHGVTLHGETRLSMHVAKGDEWVRTWEPKAKPGFTRPEEVSYAHGVGPAKLARIVAAGERLRPPHAQLAPVVEIGSKP